MRGDTDRLLEQALGTESGAASAPRPAADVEETCAAVEAIGDLTGFSPETPLSAGNSAVRSVVREWRSG